ncbi:MAG: PepSY-associated TM helix domain-containing protein [Vicinamibacterales bacterium]
MHDEGSAGGRSAAGRHRSAEAHSIDRTCGVLMVPGGSGGAFLNLRSSRDVGDPALCGTQMQYSAVTGEVYAFTTPMVPSGGAPSGLVVNAWLLQLHYARNFGPIYRGLVFALGLLLAAMSGTGVLLVEEALGETPSEGGRRRRRPRCGRLIGSPMHSR